MEGICDWQGCEKNDQADYDHGAYGRLHFCLEHAEQYEVGNKLNLKKD